ncbi:MAG TPA: ABC transporter permease [Candidatus Methylomirabilis sp.]|nr:ABC transporter permease [Candidatus Methylomirabilis sp.]
MKKWWNWRKRDKELEKEIEHHLRMAADARVERGMSPHDARAGARREFGNVGLAKELTRDAWGWRWLEDLYEDLRYGLRVLRNNPAFTLAAVLAIALGVGINVGIFSVLNGMALRLLPIPRAEQILSVNQVLHGRYRRNVHGEGGLFSYPEYLDYRDHNHVFKGLIAYEPFVEATLAGARMQQLLGVLASCNYFDVLNEHPAQGRGFIDSDCATPAASPIVVLSDDLWRRTFAGDPSLVGKSVILNQTSYTVIGIAPPGFGGTDVVPCAFWVPITMQGSLDPGRDFLGDANLSWLAMLGRLQPGVTIAQVRADLSVIAGRLDDAHPGRTTSLLISTATLFGRPEERQVLLPIASVVLAAFGLVLLIACANVANLLLARASARHKEIALRLSIGASHGRLVRQLLTESVLLSIFGGTLGSLLAFWSFAGLTHFVTSHLPVDAPTLAVNVAPDFRVLLYALGLSLVSGVVFGLMPALQSSKLDLNTALKGEGADSRSSKKSGRFLRNTLVGAQIAVCTVLLLAAGLLLRGLYYAQTVNPGFDMKNVAAAFFNLQRQGYDDNRALAFVQSLRQRIAGLPGVIETAQAECAPLSHDFSAGPMTVPGRTGQVNIEYNHISPEYFSVLSIPIVRGRGFGPNDWRDGTGIIVTESTARQLWPGEDPIGKTLLDGASRDSVIGVAKDAQVSHLGDVSTPYLYFPAAPLDNHRTYVMVRFAGGFTPTASGIRDAVLSLDPQMPVKVSKLEDYLEVWRAPARIASALSGALGGLALLLASIGVYGMVSYTVSRSVREIGIRMALGAERRQVMKLVLRQSLSPVVIGGLIGVAACAGVSWLLSSMLFGLSAHDPIAFTTVPLFLLFVALIATYVPARKAMRVDPVVALRYE